MTDEERIKTIEQIERIQEHLGSIGETVDYLDFAIKALEQEDVLKKVRVEIEAEMNNCSSMWVGHKFIGHTDQYIENVLYNAISQTKERVLDIIDKYKEGGAE